MLALILLLYFIFGIVFTENVTENMTENVIENMIENMTDNVQVVTKYGQINGFRQLVDGKKLNVFLAIPYAEPPINDLRFKKPLPIKPWTEPLNAKQLPNICIQNMFSEVFFRNRSISEDCLYLNIFAPQSNVSESKAVMIWIHGGGLVFGSSIDDWCVPDFIATKGDVIVVSINYRLSTLGFLYTGTVDSPGNVGLHDQALAIKWVKENIAEFGGDPNQITIFGESGGSLSVSLQLLSPLSRDLYKNAIMMSGAALVNLAEENEALKLWAKGSQIIGCGDGENFTKESIECLRTIDPMKLLEIPYLKPRNVEPFGSIPLVMYGNEFLPRKPIDMIEDGDYKMNPTLLVGFTEDEGSVVLPLLDPKIYGQNITNLTYDDGKDSLKRIMMRYNLNIPVKYDDITRVYYTTLPDSENKSNLYRRTNGIANGDYSLGCPTLHFAKAVYKNCKHSKVYQYYYNRKTPNIFCADWMGTCHASDIFPLFGDPFRHPEKYSDGDRKHSEVIMNMVTHFAKFGFPPEMDGIKWPNYYSINGETISPYYEFSHQRKPNGNFGNNIKHVECDILWKHYIDNQ